jgi:site-specific recombinase XerD
MKVYFTARKNKNHNIIYIEISLGRGRQYRFSTGIKFNDIKAFNNNKLRNVLTEERPKEKNKTLSDLKKYVDDQLYLYESEGTYVTKELCKNIVTSFGKASVNAKSKIQKFDLIEHLNKFIEQIKSGYILTDDEGEYSDNGIKKFITLRNHLFEFESQYGKLKPPQIDKKFFRSFQIFLSDYITTEGVKKNLINNSINKNVAILKTFINRYLLDELEVKLRNYESKVVKRLKDDNKGQVLTYLDISEILRLYNLDLSERDSVYEVVRDQWVFIALTCGIRVEDYMELDKNQNLVYIQEDEKKILALSFYQNKTNVKVVAPIGIIGKKILEKYNGTFPKVDVVTSRKLIKKICKWADISSRVYAKKVKGEPVRSYKKYELVGNHTARRSFCTNSYKAGVSEYKIMQISGHQDRESFFGYIGTTKEENAKMFSETKYFKLINEIDSRQIRNLKTV